MRKGRRESATGNSGARASAPLFAGAVRSAVPMPDSPFPGLAMGSRRSYP